VALLLWGGLTITGYSLWAQTEARVPDSPYLAGQWRFYVGLPLTITLFAAVQAAALARWKRLALMIALTCTILVVAVIAYLLPYTGGV
jgi:hypothetical protein